MPLSILLWPIYISIFNNIWSISNAWVFTYWWVWCLAGFPIHPTQPCMRLWYGSYIVVGIRLGSEIRCRFWAPCLLLLSWRKQVADWRQSRRWRQPSQKSPQKEKGAASDSKIVQGWVEEWLWIENEGTIGYSLVLPCEPFFLIECFDITKHYDAHYLNIFFSATMRYIVIYLT